MCVKEKENWNKYVGSFWVPKEKWFRIFWISNHNSPPDVPRFRKLAFLEWTRACSSELSYHCWKNIGFKEESDVAGAGTHQGPARRTYPIKRVALEGVFWFQKLQSEFASTFMLSDRGSLTKSVATRHACGRRCHLHKLWNYIKGASMVPLLGLLFTKNKNK